LIRNDPNSISSDPRETSLKILLDYIQKKADSRPFALLTHAATTQRLNL